MNGQEITIEQALRNIDSVLAQFKGNREEHFILQKSFQKIKEEIEKNKEKETISFES